MLKKPHVTTLINRQHVKRSQTLLKSLRQYFGYIFWSLWKKISSKNPFLEVSEVLRLFFNILTPDEKYFFSEKVSA